MRSVRIIDHPSFSMSDVGPFGTGVPSQEQVDKAERTDRMAQLEANVGDREMKAIQLDKARLEQSSGLLEATIDAEKHKLSIDAQNAAIEEGARAGSLGVAPFLSNVRPSLVADIKVQVAAGNTEGARLAYAKLQAATSQVGDGLASVASYTGNNPLIASLREQAVAASNMFIGSSPAEHQEAMTLMNPAANPNSVAFSTTKNLKDNPSLSVEDARIKAEAENPAASSEARAQYDVLNKLGVYGEPTVVAGPDGKRRVVQAAPSEDAAPAAAFHKTLVPKLAASGQISQEDAIKTSGQITGALVKTQFGKNNWSSIFESAKSIIGGLPPDQIVGAIDEVSTGLSAVMDSIKVKDPEGKVYVNPLEQATLQQFATKAFESSVKSLTAGLTNLPGDNAQRASIISKASTSLAKLNAEFKQMGIAEDMATDANAKYAGEIAAYRTGTNRSVLSDGAKTLLSKIELARKMAGNAPIASPMQEALGGAESLSGLARSTEAALQKHIMRAVVTGGDSTPAGAGSSLDAATEPIAQEIATRYGLSMDQTRPLADAYIAAKKIDPNVTVDAVGTKLVAPTPSAAGGAGIPPANQSGILVQAAAPTKSFFFEETNRAESFTKGLTDQLVAPGSPFSLNEAFTLGDVKNPNSTATQAKVEEFLSTKVIPGVKGLGELISDKPEVKETLRTFIQGVLTDKAVLANESPEARRAYISNVSDTASLSTSGFVFRPEDLTRAVGTGTWNRMAAQPGGAVPRNINTAASWLQGALVSGGSFTMENLGKAVRIASSQKQAAATSPEAAAKTKQEAQAKAFGEVDSGTLDAAAQTASLVKERMNLPLATVLGKKAITECDKTVAYLTNIAPASGAQAQGILLQMLSDGEEAKNPAAFVKKFNTKIAETLKKASELVIQNAANKALVAQQVRSGEYVPPIDTNQ